MATKGNYQPLPDDWTRFSENTIEYRKCLCLFEGAVCREFLIYANGELDRNGRYREDVDFIFGSSHFNHAFITKDPAHQAMDRLKNWLIAHGYQITVLCERRWKDSYKFKGRTPAQQRWMQGVVAAIERGEIPIAETPLKQGLLDIIRHLTSPLRTNYHMRLLVRAPPKAGLPPRKYINASPWNLPEDLILEGSDGTEVKINSTLVKLREAEHPNPSGEPSWFGLYFSNDTFDKGTIDDSSDPEVSHLDFREYRFAVLKGLKSFLVDPEGFRNEFIGFPSIHYIHELLMLSKFLMFNSFTYFLLSIGEQLEQSNVCEFAPGTSRKRLDDGSLNERKPLYPGFVADFAGDHLELAPAINAKLWNKRSYSDYIVMLLNLPNEINRDDSYIKEHAPDMRLFSSSSVTVTKKFTFFYGAYNDTITYVRPHRDGALILAIGRDEDLVQELTQLHGHDSRFKICYSDTLFPGENNDPEAFMYQSEIESLRYSGCFADDSIDEEFPDDAEQVDQTE